MKPKKTKSGIEFQKGDSPEKFISGNFRCGYKKALEDVKKIRCMCFIHKEENPDYKCQFCLQIDKLKKEAGK